MADIESARAAAESSAIKAQQATAAFENAVDDWSVTLRDAVPTTVLTQARRYVEGEPDVSLSLGREKVQELKAEVQQLADELKVSIPAKITPERVRAAEPDRRVTYPARTDEVAKAARRDVLQAMERPLGRVLERYGFTWDGWITKSEWDDAEAALEDEHEIKAAKKVSSTLQAEKTAKIDAARASDALDRSESASLWD